MRFLIISLIALLPTTLFGQQLTDKMFITTQFCGPWEDVMNTPKKYKEAMLFTGTGLQFATANGGQPFTGGMFFFVNQETGTYSIINIYGDGIACLMQSGKDFAPYGGKQPWDEIAPEGDKG
jgi:hypothetical protein